MRELEFRRALREEMSQVTRPRPLTETEVLDSARRALRRRRSAWASAGSVLAVVALTVATAIAATGDNQSGPSAGSASTTPSSVDTPTPSAGETSGPHYERSATLFRRLREIVPPGFDILRDVPPDAGSLEGHSADFRGYEGEERLERWEYVAVITVVKDGQYGRLLVNVRTSENFYPRARGCALTLPDPASEPSSTCQEILVDGVPVGVKTNSNMNGIQSSLYRHRDGTVVFLEQDHAAFDPSFPILTELPFTAQQLAELVVDRRWHVT